MNSASRNPADAGWGVSPTESAVYRAQALPEQGVFSSTEQCKTTELGVGAIAACQ